MGFLKESGQGINFLRVKMNHHVLRPNLLVLEFFKDFSKAINLFRIQEEAHYYLTVVMEGVSLLPSPSCQHQRADLWCF